MTSQKVFKGLFWNQRKKGNANLISWWMAHQKRSKKVIGIIHQKNFYRLNLIFWIVMGSGIARFDRKGLKTTETWKFWSQILSPGVLRRGAPGVSRHSAMGFGGAAPWGLEGRRTDKTLQWFIILRCPSRSHLITRDLEGQRKMINHWSVLLVRRPSKPHGAVPRNPRCAAPQNPT